MGSEIFNSHCKASNTSVMSTLKFRQYTRKLYLFTNFTLCSGYLVIMKGLFSRF